MLALAASCCLLGNLAAADTAMDEIVVRGERPGPRLWHVSRDAAQVWILGTVSPLPTDITWRGSEVERLLDRADVVLAAKPLEITIPRVLWILLTKRDILRIPGGRKLSDVLPPGLYARFAAQRARYGGGKWERYRPLVAGALLEDDALKKNGLSTRLDLSLTVRRLARKHRVPIDEVNIPGAPDLLEALRTVTPETESKCLAAMLDTVESGLPLLADRARAWSTGDVERLRILPASTEATCGALMSATSRASGLLAQIHDHWLEALEAHLRRDGVTVAVVDMDLLLGRGGLLDGLRADGYLVEGP